MHRHATPLPKSHPAGSPISIYSGAARLSGDIAHYLDKKRPPISQPSTGDKGDFEPPHLRHLLRASNSDGNQILMLVLDEPDADLAGEGFFQHVLGEICAAGSICCALNEGSCLPPAQGKLVDFRETDR